VTSVGLVGFGFAGRSLHAPLILAAGLHIAGVVTRRAGEVGRMLPDARVFADTAGLLAQQEIDLVVIATPHHLHARQAAEALDAGKHVVIDKPIAVRVDEAERLIELAAQRQRVLSVFHNRRWDSDFLTLRKLVCAGRLGELHALHVRWDRFRPEVADRWRERAAPGGGVLYDLGPHLIDQALCLFGWPDWVQADVFAQRPGALTDDGFEILMAKGAARISLGASSLAVDGGWRYRVHGARASFLKAGLDVQEQQLRDGRDPLAEDFGVEPESQWGRLVDAADGRVEAIRSERGTWLEFYRSLSHALETGAPPLVSAVQGRDVLRIVQAAAESSREGRRISMDASGRSR
jgi:scyllo-inositol 2-dehydrogenase (NADP+)